MIEKTTSANDSWNRVFFMGTFLLYEWIFMNGSNIVTDDLQTYRTGFLLRASFAQIIP